MSAPPQHDFDLVIRAGERPPGYWRELWQRRGLALHLARRDLAVRYRQTVLGVVWALLRPLLSMGALTIVFGVVAALPSPGASTYPLMVLTALLPWQLFTSGVVHASVSLTANAALVSRVYFPRLVLPASALVSGALDFALALALLLVLLLVEGSLPGWRLLLLPPLALLTLLAAAGIGTLFAALHVRYRDFGYVAPFVMQLGFFLSPIGFSSAVVPAEYRLAFALNPLVGVIEGFRWALLGAPTAIDLAALSLSAVVSVLLLAIGTWTFRRAEPDFADHL